MRKNEIKVGERNLFEYAYEEEKERQKTMTETNKPLGVEIYEKRIGLLSWNFEELNRGLDARLQKYKNLQYTDDQIDLAKKDRANLNNFKKAINDRKIELKKEFCEPYDDFAAQVKQLTAKIDEAVYGIDQQVKAYEQKEKDDKKARITTWWDENGAKLYKIPIDSVFDEKFLLKGCKDAAWQKALQEKAAQIDRDLDTISRFPDIDQLNFCVPEYLKRLDLGQTLSAWEEKKEADRQAAELKERMEKERQEREAQRRAYEEQRAAARAAEPAKPQEPAAPIEQTQEPKIFTRAMKVQGTREQIVALADFMKANGIKFWKIEVPQG